MAEIAHKERAHALLSASGASRWMACTPSARLEENFEEKESVYAAEGTLAHEIAELKLRKHFTEPMAKSTFTRRLNKFKKHELYQDEMLRHTDTYLEYLQELALSMGSAPYVAVEKRLDFSKVVPEGFGTVDCLMVGGDTLYITDFKYGKGVPVSAEDNPQMKLYALGAYLEYSFLYPIKNVHLAIIQPRLDSISEWSLTADSLLEWAKEVEERAKLAWEGKGDFVPGEHCKFCKAKAQCRARSEQYTALADFEAKKPELLTDEEVGTILEKAVGIESWVKSLKDHALTVALNGGNVPGWKAVEGRGSRNFTDLDKAFEHLQSNNIEEAMLYERVPLSVAKLEKALGKKDFRELLEEQGFVVKQPGKPTLVPTTDKRKAITNAVDPAEDFK